MTGEIARRARQALKLLRLLARPGYWRGLRFGVGATIEHAPVIRALRPANVVDVGANVGQFSLLAATLCPNARIIAFEPMPDAAATYRKLFAGNARVTLHQLAIAADSGEATLHVSARADSSSLLPIGEGQTTVFPGTEEVGAMQIETAPLDAVLKPEDIVSPALMKIDLQGYELEVLRGSAALLPRFDHIYVEASFVPLYEGQPLYDEVASFLKEHGFHEAERHNLTVDAKGAPVQADFLFARSGA
jgi:FkbM family methyltransferase